MELARQLLACPHYLEMLRNAAEVIHALLEVSAEKHILLARKLEAELCDFGKRALLQPNHTNVIIRTVMGSLSPTALSCLSESM